MNPLFEVAIDIQRVKLEFVPVPRVPGPVDAASCDVVMSGIAIIGRVRRAAASRRHKWRWASCTPSEPW